MSSEERAENLAKSIALGAMNPYYVKWDAIVKHAADVLRAERLAALEEAAMLWDKDIELARQSVQDQAVLKTMIWASEHCAARIRALKGDK